MTLAKDIASHLLKIQAVYLKPEEPFTWASGIKSPIYTDNRVTLAYPETRNLIENGFVEAIKEAFPEVEVIAGTATAGIPHGAIIADKMNLPFAYIRSKPKDHGAGNQIEGRVAQGQKMVVVEDLISSTVIFWFATDIGKWQVHLVSDDSTMRNACSRCSCNHFYFWEFCLDGFHKTIFNQTTRFWVSKRHTVVRINR